MIQIVSTGKNKLDSVKLAFPVEVLSLKRESAFGVSRKFNPEGEEVSASFKLDVSRFRSDELIGLKTVELIGERGVIEFSAKVLRERYHELISIGNIEEVIACVNGVGAFTLDANRFLDQAEVCRFDCTTDLHVTGDVGDYLQSLRVYGALLWNWETTPYKRTGFVFKKKVSSYHERVLFYDKYTEVIKDKYREVLNPDRFENVIRVETNHTDLKHIRKRFNLNSGAVRLMEVLASKENVNLKLFTSIVDSPDIVEARKRFDLLRSGGEQLKYIEKRKGMEGIIRDCNYDMLLIRLFLRSTVKGSINRYYNRYQECLADMIARGEGNEQTQAEFFDTDHIEEMRELLKVA
jgi:hypothetical protein